METNHLIFRILLYASIGFLAVEALTMAFLLGGTPPPPRYSFVEFHTVLVFVVGLAAALLLSRALAYGRTDIPIAIACTGVLLAFNPLYPLLPLAVSISHIFIANLLAIGLLIWASRRMSATYHGFQD